MPIILDVNFGREFWGGKAEEIAENFAIKIR